MATIVTVAASQTLNGVTAAQLGIVPTSLAAEAEAEADMKALDERMKSLELGTSIHKSAYSRSFRRRRLTVDNTVPFAVAFNAAVKSTLIASGVPCTAVTITNAVNTNSGVSITYAFSVSIDTSTGATPAAVVAAATTSLTTAATSSTLLTAINAGSGSSAWSSLITGVDPPRVISVGITTGTFSPTSAPVSSSSNTLAIGLGAGLGAGIPVVLGIAGLFYYYTSKASPSKGGVQPVSQHDVESSGARTIEVGPAGHASNTDVRRPEPVTTWETTPDGKKMKKVDLRQKS